MAVESAAIGGLNPEQENEVTPILSLNQDGYSLWRNAVTVSKNYYKKTTSETGVNTLWRKGLLNTQESDPRCIGPNCRCDCVISISFPGQCGHDIANHDGDFVKERWSKRYYRLEELETSSVTCMHEVDCDQRSTVGIASISCTKYVVTPCRFDAASGAVQGGLDKGGILSCLLGRLSQGTRGYQCRRVRLQAIDAASAMDMGIVGLPADVVESYNDLPIIRRASPPRQ
jgi:hypothetical protein